MANEQPEKLDQLEQLARALGDDVVAREVDVLQVRAAAAEVHPDVALVGLYRRNLQHALELIEELVTGGLVPVVAVTDGDEPDFAAAAATKGVFAHVSAPTPDRLQSAIDVALRRYFEYSELQGALARRAIVERAKGILMERYMVDERRAFELLRTHARNSGRRLVEVAEAVQQTHTLLHEVREREAAEAQPEPAG